HLPSEIVHAQPMTWLDLLTAADRRRAQRMIDALGELGLPDAEDVARVRMEGKSDRRLARRLVQARLDRLLDEAGADEDARRLVGEAVKALTSGGGGIGRDLPGWALFETDPDGSATGRQIDLE
ncbi:MAG: hypothetical protein ABI841_06245, partial [Chloroflexota bacterium]